MDQKENFILPLSANTVNSVKNQNKTKKDKTDDIFGYWYFALETNVVPVLACGRPQYQVKMHACGIQYFAWDLRQLLTDCLVSFLTSDGKFSFFCFCLLKYKREKKKQKKKNKSGTSPFVNPYHVTLGSSFLCPPVSCSLYITGRSFCFFVLLFFHVFIVL